MQVRKYPAITLAIVLGFSALASLSIAQQPPATSSQSSAVKAKRPPDAGGGTYSGPLVIQPLNGGVYWAKGPSMGLNSISGIIVGQNGVFLFDTKGVVDAEKELLAEIAKITPKPITHVILSHQDGDHINGLVALPKGVTIIAQEYCAKAMADSVAKGGRGAASPDYLPTKTFSKDESMTIDGVRVRLLHFAPAHTGGDTMLYLPDQKIVFMGDIVISEQVFPVLHVDEGGSVQGIVESIKGLLALDATTYVSGHGELADKSDLKARADEWGGSIEKVKSLIAQGKSLEEIKQAMGDPAPQPVAPGGRGPRQTLTDMIYQELTKK